MVIRTDECDGFAMILCPCRTADTMHIVFGITRDIVVDDQRYIVHIDAAGNDIRSD